MVLSSCKTYGHTFGALQEVLELGVELGVDLVRFRNVLDAGNGQTFRKFAQTGCMSAISACHAEPSTCPPWVSIQPSSYWLFLLRDECSSYLPIDNSALSFASSPPCVASPIIPALCFDQSFHCAMTWCMGASKKSKNKKTSR